jgi:predicted permease
MAMPNPRAWLRTIGFFGPDPDVNVEDEIRFHLEMRARDLAARGMSLDQARAEAVSRFGDVERVRAECRVLERAKARRQSRKRWIGDAWMDVRVGARVLTREPVFAIAIVLSLGLGIGANAALFSAVNALLLKPMQARDPDRIVTIGETFRDNPLLGNVDYASALTIAERTDVFDGVVAFNGDAVAMRDGNVRSREFASLVTGNYFSMLGLQPQTGRLLAEHDDRERAMVAVISDELWERHFRRDPAAVGRTVHLNGSPVTIVGVAPAGFVGTQPMIRSTIFLPAEIQAPLRLNGCVIRVAGCWSARVLARLRDGVPLSRARAVLRSVAEEIDRARSASQRGVAFPVEWERRSRPEPAIARNTPWLLGIFFALASLALLVACANVANLLLARALHRKGEIAVRRAIGATPGRVARQLIAESVLLALCALVVAIGVATAVVRWLDAVDLAVDVPLNFGVALDWRVFVYSALVTLGVGVLAGLAPALFGRGLALSEALGDGAGRGAAGGGRRAAVRSTLVAAQVAVSLVLLVCAALFTRSVRAGASVDLGFATDSVIMASTDLTPLDMTVDERRAFQESAREQASQLPGAISAGYGDHIPFNGNLNSSVVVPEFVSADAAVREAEVYRARVSPGFLTTLGFRLTSGRDLSERDTPDAPRIAVVNEAMADLFWPGANPVGQRFRFAQSASPQRAADTAAVEIVGVIATAKYLFVNESPRPFLYEAIAQRPSRTTFLVVRTAVPALTLAGPLRSTISALHPEVVPYGVRSLRDYLNLGMAFFFLRLAALLATAIGGLALLQTLVGLYGVLAYLVSQRRQEFGIRMALGARPQQVIGGVLRQGSRVVAIGMAVGLVLALLLTRAMRAFLVGVSPTDLLAFGGAAGVLLACAFTASWIPARRAAGVNPSSALRGVAD